MGLVALLLGRRVDPREERVWKFFPSSPPRRGDRVIVGDETCRVTWARVRYEREPVPHPKFGLASPLYRWRLLSLRVKAASR